MPGAGDFVQQLPRENRPATEPTEVWVFFDDKNLYIAARCFDSHPEREVATEMRRDDNNVIQNESLSFVLDTFYDRRNGFFFQTSPLGTIRDQSIADEQLNQSWNTVWDVKSARDNKGWTTEMVIPFKSLRYAGRARRSGASTSAASSSGRTRTTISARCRSSTAPARSTG